MNKRKIALMAMCLCMVAILAVGGSLAYFYDADSRTNVFTVGNVTIDLYEDFDETDPDGTANDNIAELHPVTYDENGNRRDENVIEKEVYVENTGSEDAYVRVHIAIPQVLDNGDPTFDASSNVLHFNYDKENSLGADMWDWSDAKGAPYEGEWNYYETTIGNIPYNVYVVTYGAALQEGEQTEDAMSQVYLDKKVTNADITKIKNGYTDEDGNKVVGLGEQWKIHVIAEGCQAKGFNDAYEALNVSFGVPGNYIVDWDADTIGTQDLDEAQEEPTTVTP